MNEEKKEEQSEIKEPVFPEDIKEVAEVKEVAPVEVIDYETDNLKNIEAAREIFLKQYKVQNIVKWLVSIVSLGLIVLAWLVLLPINLYLAIGTIGLSLLLILLYNFFIKRYLNGKMKIYFDAFYKNTTEFIFEGTDYTRIRPSLFLRARIIPMSNSKSKTKSNRFNSRKIIFTPTSFKSEAVT